MAGWSLLLSKKDRRKGGVDVQQFPAYWNVERRYMEYESNKYIVDVINKNGFRTIVENLDTGKRNEGFHRASENEAVMEALRKF